MSHFVEEALRSARKQVEVMLLCVAVQPPASNRTALYQRIPGQTMAAHHFNYATMTPSTYTAAMWTLARLHEAF